EAGRGESSEDRRGAQQQRPCFAICAAPPDGDRGKDGHVDEIVSPEVEDPSPSGLLELQASQLSIAAVDNRMQEEKQCADGLENRPREKEEGSPAQSNGDADQGHLIRRDRRRREPASQRERDLSLEMA